MVAVVRRRLDRNLLAIVGNASSLVGTTAITSLLGFVYWLAAARSFPAMSIGLAATSITSMTFLASLGVLGLGTLLIGEFGRQAGKEGVLMTTALAAAGSSGSLLGLVFILVASHLSPRLALLGVDFSAVCLFTVGTGMTSVSLVFDSAVVGLLRGGLQLLRNSLFALLKLFALLGIAAWHRSTDWHWLFATWVVAIAVSLAGVAVWGTLTGSFRPLHRPQWSILRNLRHIALSHHSVNLGLQAPGLLLPLVATIALSPAKTATYYVAWQVASFSFVAPIALSLALYAVSGTKRIALRRDVRMTFSLGMALGAFTTTTLVLLSGPLLHLFGRQYTNEGPVVLSILSLCVFPLVVKDLYIALCRISRQLRNAALLVGVGAPLEVAVAVAGALIGDLRGFALACLVAECVVGLVAARPVVSALRSRSA